MNRCTNNERPQFKSGSRMPIARWKAVSEHAKKTWDAMKDDEKALLVLAPQEKREEQALQSDRSKFSVNAAMLTPNAPSDNASITMVTKHSNHSKSSGHPADIRSVLSEPAKVAKAQAEEDEISVNGHACARQVLHHDIQCSVSQASREKESSLVDQGANGGIAGVDTVLTRGSLNAILIGRFLTFMVLTIMRSLPFLL